MQTISDFCNVAEVDKLYQEFKEHVELSTCGLLRSLTHENIIEDPVKYLNDFCSGFVKTFFGFLGKKSSGMENNEDSFDSVDKTSVENLLTFIEIKGKGDKLKAELVGKYKAQFLRRLIKNFTRMPLSAILNDSSDLIDKFSYIKLFSEEFISRQQKMINTITFLTNIIVEEDKRFINKRLHTIILSFPDYWNALKYYNLTTDSPTMRIQKIVSKILCDGDTILPTIIGSQMAKFNELESDINDYLAERLTTFLNLNFAGIMISQVYDILILFMNVDVKERLKKMETIIRLFDYLIQNDKESPITHLSEHSKKVSKIDEELHMVKIPSKIQNVRGPFDSSGYSRTHEANLRYADRRVVTYNAISSMDFLGTKLLSELGIESNKHRSNSIISVVFGEFISMENSLLDFIIDNNISNFSSFFIRIYKKFNDFEKTVTTFNLLKKYSNTLSGKEMDNFIHLYEKVIWYITEVKHNEKYNKVKKIEEKYGEVKHNEKYNKVKKIEEKYGEVKKIEITEDFVDFLVKVIQLPAYRFFHDLPYVLVYFFETYGDKYEDYLFILKLARAGRLDIPMFIQINFSALFTNINPHPELYIRIAKMLVHKNLFDPNYTEYQDLVTCNDHNDAILNYISHDELNVNFNETIYKQSIDVHHDNRDTKTELGVSLMIESQNLSDDEAISEFNEFWEYSKSLPEESKRIFFRVMGYDHNMNKYSKDIDFAGFLTEDVKIKDKNINPKVVLGNFWKFTKDYKSENIKSALFSGIMSCYQKNVSSWSCVCNKGKLQYMTVSVLQGRISYHNDNGEHVIFQVDDLNLFDTEQVDENLTPAEIYKKLLPFIQEVCDHIRPKDANGLFKELFLFIDRNNLNISLEDACRVISLYAETSNGFDVNPELSIVSNFENCFDLDEYSHIVSQIKVIQEERLEQRFDDEDDEETDVDVDDNFEERIFNDNFGDNFLQRFFEDDEDNVDNVDDSDESEDSDESDESNNLSDLINDIDQQNNNGDNNKDNNIDNNRDNNIDNNRDNNIDNDRENVFRRFFGEFLNNFKNIMGDDIFG